jgi:HK97 family phage major capsid protein
MDIEKLLAEKDAIRSKLGGEDEMTAEDLDTAEARIKEIDAKVDELRKSAEAAKERRAKLTADLEAQYQRGELRTIATMHGNGAEVRGSIHETTDFSVSGEVYKRAWLKDMAKRCGVTLFDGGEMTDAEKRAFTATTANTPQVLPTVIQTHIWDLVQSSQAFYADLNIDNARNVYQLVRHTAIAAGDAAQTDENVAATDEQNTFTTIDITGEEFKKTAAISRKMATQSFAGFEAWLEREVAGREGNALDVFSLARLDDATLGMDATNKALTAKTAGTLIESDLRKMLAVIKADADGMALTKPRTIYASATTIWDYIAGIQYNDGRPAFIGSTMDSDPLTQGRVYGTIVKQDDHVADGTIICGLPAAMSANLFSGIDVTPFIDPKTQEHSYTAYALFDCGLSVPKAFAKLTIGAGA